MRGKVGQDPMIIDVPYSTSNDSGSTYSRDSDDSSEPETPPASDSDNQDRRYIWKPEPDIPIPQAYDTTKNAKSTKQREMNDISNEDRGRRLTPKLDTNLGRVKSTQGFPPPLERARSPYASGPQDRKPKPNRSSGEYLLSPDIMSPRKTYADSPRSQSQYFPRPIESHANGRPVQGKSGAEQLGRPPLENHRSYSYHMPRPVEDPHIRRETQVRENPRGPPRPSIDRRASELPCPTNSAPISRRTTQEWNQSTQPVRPPMDRRASNHAYPTTPSSTGDLRPMPRPSHGSHDDSDSDHTKIKGKIGRVSSQTLPSHQTSSLKEARHHRRESSSEIPGSPSHYSVPSSDTDDPPVNLSSLVSGAAIHQTLTAMLNGDQGAGRRASPRPSPKPSPGVSPLASPRGSPKSSPYSSPPRTPPSELSHHRANPIRGLKKDSPSSRPSSPLSSRSSTWTMEPERHPRTNDQNGRSRPAPLKSRRTAPLPSPRLEEPEESEPSTPGIFVRSPSPAIHAKSFSMESGSIDHSEIGSRPTMPKEPSQTSTLRPTGFSGRPRAASSSDVRPQLIVNPAPFLQGSDSSSSARSKSRGSSPSIVSPSERYKPTRLEPTSPSVKSNPAASLSGTRPRSRSRSYVPETSHTAHVTQHNTLNTVALASRSRSTMTAPSSVDARSQSFAPRPSVAAAQPLPIANLPICPRPHPATGHDDWYTLNQNHAFTICPNCRDNVFGSTYMHYLQPRAPTTKKTLCDLNNPWVRLACLLRGPDVNLISALADVTSMERACPEDELAPRNWYRLEDPDSGKHITGVNTCPHCVHSLEILFPPWKDVFYRPRSSHHHELKERFCSLRSSSIRFGDYLDMVVESSREADSKRRPPNTRPACELAKQLAAVDDCPQDKMNPRKAWHIHPHLPEFTICQDCYETVVYPLVKNGSPLAAKIDKKPQQFPNPDVKCCCNLYSPRMRKVFREACEDDDYEHLRHTVLKRHMLQQDLLETLGEKEEHPRDDEITDRLEELVAKWKEKE